ncbi:aconitate hydratase [Shewanella sp. Actino-trap-3]|uniref:AMP-binding protein n=1 Tax=Shewanella sp. Actino-trap-3 TaxID=2058331 RepID=UPI000C31F444|nr:AMP-binding protein [Shewanella sp. Actino-trap-3]PKG78972.1 aconitate hydratase [Shewanella sp. Actino-trap-3]
MNKLLLNWLSTGPASQQLISFDHHDIMTGSLFCAHVAHLHAQLTQSAAKRWLLAAKHSDLFAAGLCAALLAGKQVILPANTQSGTLSQLNHEFDAIIADTPLCEVGEYIALKKELSLPAATWPKSESLGELILFTSGSSGQPKAVKKTLQQLDAEVSILEQTFAEHLPHCSVVSTVSHQHIYGLLFKVLWPLAASRAFLSEQIDFPETLSYYLAIMPNLCLISSPAQLTRLPDALDNQKQQRIPSLIFSSGGPLNFDAAQAVKQCFYQLPIEIFGSTETGGIAYRRQQQPLQPWQAFTQVKIDIDPQDGALMLQSVYLDNQAQWLRCDDKIELLTDGQFRLLHRLDRIVKIEEKRLSLAQVEYLLQTHPFVREAAVTVLEQPRTMLGAAICLSELGLKTLEAEGKLALNNALKNHLLSQFERITLPRRWRYPAHLPLNSQGKRTQAEIIALFSHD